MPGYQIYRWDHNRHGGGVAIAIYVHISLSCKVVLEGGLHNLEFLSLSILSHSFLGKFCVCLFYRPPSHPASIFDNLCSTLQIVNSASFSTILLLGDFNVNTDHFVCDILYSFSLTQVVPSYTHESQWKHISH